MGKATPRTIRNRLRKKFSPSCSATVKKKEPQIIEVDCCSTGEPEIICLDNGSFQKSNSTASQFIDLVDDDVTVLPTRSKNKSFVVDDVYFDTQMDSIRLANVTNICQLEENLSGSVKRSNSKCSESNCSAILPQDSALNVGSLSDSKSQPFSETSLPKLPSESIIGSSTNNSPNNSSSCKTKTFSQQFTSDPAPINFTPYKRFFNLPDPNEITLLKELKNDLIILSENNSCETPLPFICKIGSSTPNIRSSTRNKFKSAVIPSENNSCETPLAFICKIGSSTPNIRSSTRNKFKSAIKSQCQQILMDETKHCYPLRSQGPCKSLSKPINQIKIPKASKTIKCNKALFFLDDNDKTLTASINLDDEGQNFSENTKFGEVSDSQNETGEYVSPKRGKENEMPQKSDLSNFDVNFIPLPPTSKKIENELIKIYNKNKNRRSMKTDFSSSKISLERSINGDITLKNKNRKRRKTDFSSSKISLERSLNGDIIVKNKNQKRKKTDFKSSKINLEQSLNNGTAVKNEKRKSVKTDFSSSKINLERSLNGGVTVKKMNHRRLKRNFRSSKINLERLSTGNISVKKKKRKSMESDSCSPKVNNLEGLMDSRSPGLNNLERLQQQLLQEIKNLSTPNKNSKQLKTSKRLRKRKRLQKKVKRVLNSPKNHRVTDECEIICHSTPFASKFRSSEESAMNFSNKSMSDFKWVTLDECNGDSDDEAQPSECSASHHSLNTAPVSPTKSRPSCSTDYSVKSPDRLCTSKSKSESLRYEKITVNTQVMDSEKEIVVIDDDDDDDDDTLVDASDTLSLVSEKPMSFYLKKNDKTVIDHDAMSLTSEESFSIDIGSNVFVPSGVSFKGRRPIIIDGSNVAFSHALSTRGLRVFSSRGIDICAKYFIKRGHKVIVFVPLFRRWHSQTLNPEILQKMSDNGLVTYTPSRKINEKMQVPYDDRYIVQCAVALGGVIVSTDNYRDLVNENPTWRVAIEKRLLMFTFVGDMLMFPQDPLGRHGPKLDEFLMFPR